MGIVIKKTVSVETGKLRRNNASNSLKFYNAIAMQLIRPGTGKYIETVFLGYAQVYFSKKWIVGLLFLLSTFIIPVIGAAGLSGLVMSLLFARGLGFSKASDDDIFFGYNGLLTALALGLTYKLNIPFVMMMILSMFLCVLMASTLRTLFEKYLFVPVLSLPFIITTWIIIAAGRRFQRLIYTTQPFEVEFLNGFFPEPLEFMFRSFGAAFFQLSVPAGCLVALGILVYSRHAFIVASASLFFASTFHISSGGSMADLNGQWIGFNFALTAIAVGGMFVVPGISSYALALMSALVSSVVAAASLMILTPLGLPVLALPFVLTTQMILYPLRNRIEPKFLKSITNPKESPEKNLKHFNNPRAGFISDETPAFHLPVSGEWTITQGFNGSETHKGLWAQALDFEVADENGRTYQTRGTEPADYYSWNMPVFAPCDGVVTKVINNVEDNVIGQVNSKNNWGNTVIIWHYGSVYTSLSHLAKESVTVSEGETIKKGKIIGKVGNSGRSPFPHLHFQVQYSPALGAHTVPFKFLNYISKETNIQEYHIAGVPVKDQIVETAQADVVRSESGSFPIGGTWYFEVQSCGRIYQETWVSDIDFIGNRFLRCTENNAKLQFFANNNMLLLIDYEGASGTALEWFFLSAPCIPFTRKTVQLVEKMPPERLLNPVARMLFDSVEPVCELASLTASLKVSAVGKEQLSINTDLSLKTGLISKRESRREIQTLFGKHKGLMSLHVTCSGNTIFQVSQKDAS